MTEEGASLYQMSAYTLDDFKQDFKRLESQTSFEQLKLSFEEGLYICFKGSYEAELWLLFNEETTTLETQIRVFKIHNDDFFEVFWEEFEMDEETSLDEIFETLCYAIECVAA